MGIDWSVEDMIIGIIASQITSAPTPIWVVTSGPSYDQSVTLFSETTNEATITSLLTTNYPPGNYAVGYVMRAQIYNSEMTLIGTAYRARSSA